MAVPTIQRPRPQVTRQGSAGGAGVGRMIGTGLGAFLGSAGGIAGAAKGASLGGTLGGLAGAAVAPPQAAQVSQQPRQAATPRSAMEVSNDAQSILQALQALEQMPSLTEKFTKPLAQAYIQSQIELKQKG